MGTANTGARIKAYRELRDRERDRRVPALKVGSIYFIRSSGGNQPHKGQPVA